MQKAREEALSLFVSASVRSRDSNDPNCQDEAFFSTWLKAGAPRLCYKTGLQRFRDLLWGEVAWRTRCTLSRVWSGPFFTSRVVLLAFTSLPLLPLQLEKSSQSPLHRSLRSLLGQGIVSFDFETGLENVKYIGFWTTSEMRDGTRIISILSTDTCIHGVFLIQGMQSKESKEKPLNSFRDVETGTYRTQTPVSDAEAE